MGLSHLVLCCFAMHTVTEGRIVRATIGQNVSLSFTIKNMREDIINIKHETTNIVRVWPANNFSRPEQPDRVRVLIDNKMASSTVVVTVYILNITKNDVGMYRAVGQLKPMDVIDSLLLETIVVDHYTIEGTSLIEDIDVIKHYTSEATRLTEDTEEIIHYTSRKEKTEGHYNYTSAATAPKDDTQDVPLERHLLYIIFGMGAILAAASLAFLRHKIRICLRVDRRSISNSAFNNVDVNEDQQDVNLFGNYWTIVGNAEGELRTAIEMGFELRREPLLIQPIISPAKSKSKEPMIPENIISIQELDEYLDPINSSTVEFDGYIHPIHSDNVNPCSSIEI